VQSQSVSDLLLSVSAEDGGVLRSLLDWLRHEDALRGRVRPAQALVRPGEMGAGVFDALEIALGSGGAGAVLAASVSAWLSQPRRADVRLTVTAPDGRHIEFDARRVRGPAVLVRGSSGCSDRRQLIEQIKKLAIALDPEWARRRYEQALADRKVVGSRNPDGSANLSGLNLPVERVAAACGHIDELAKAAKHAGDPRPIDHIRAELFLGMTDGTYTGLDGPTILERLRAAHHSDEPANDEAGDAPECHDQPRDNDEPDHDGPEDSGASTQDGHAAAGEPVVPRRPSGAGMELRVRLSTLLGRDEYPAELAGWGPVPAGLARALATTMTRGQWRFALTDAHGQLLHCGITHARPLGLPTRTASCRQIVELQIPASTLHELARDPAALGSWGPVVTDLAHQHGSAQQTAADPIRRFPGAALRRHIEIRDRFCIMIGCRAPTRGTDTDHTLDHAHGGATADHNLGTVCRHDHRLKHEGGWRLHQLEPGVFQWRSRLGHVYHLRPFPIIEPLPDPLLRDRPAPPLFIRPDGDWETSCIWDDTTRSRHQTPAST